MIKFVPNPEIAIPTQGKGINPADYGPQYKAVYYADYLGIFAAIAAVEDEQVRRQTEISIYRELIKTDLFFIGFFVCENPYMNHPFAVDKCHLLADGPQTDTLDVWARYHLKSSIITHYETIQHCVTHPEECTCIFSYSKPAAEKHLLTIKETLQKDIMRVCFPDVLFDNPFTQSASWSLQGGIRINRQTVSRKEHTVQAHGLLEGMPTGGHWERLIFDDVETEDLARNPDQIAQLIKSFEMASQTFGMPNGSLTRIIGTFYTHCGLLTYLRDKRYLDDDKELMYLFRKFAATDDGTKKGNPVFMDDKSWRKILTSPICNSQFLCDPTQTSEMKLDFNMFKPIEPQFMPKNRLKFVLIDPAGDDAVQSGTKNDLWSIGCISIKPCMDELGLSEIYIEDVVADQMPLNTAIDAAVNLYIRNGRIAGLGIEKVGNDTTYEHIRKALIAKGRYVTIKKSDRDNGNLVLLSPEGRNKEWRVESALSWPLSNSKVFYSTSLDTKVLSRIREECEKFGFIHLDILDMISYIYKIVEVMKIYLESMVGEEIDESDKVYHAETEYNPFAI